MIFKAYRYILIMGVAVLVLTTFLQIALLYKTFETHKSQDIYSIVNSIESKITGHLELLKFVPHAPPYIKSLAWLIDELESYPTLKGIMIASREKILVNTFSPGTIPTGMDILKRCYQGFDYENSFFFCTDFTPLPDVNLFLLISIDRTLEIKTLRRTLILNFLTLILGSTLYGISWYYIGKLGKRQKYLENKLMISEKLAVIGKLSTMVAHEIRNPLNTISMSIQYMEKQGSIDEEFFGIIKSEIKKLSELSSELLLLDRGFEFKMKEVTLSELLTEICSRFEMRFHSRKISFSLSAPDEKTIIRCDKKWLKRAIENILRNAYEATPSGGKVILEVLRAPNNVSFRVTDTGPGIPENVRERIFEPFFTTKQSGFGLGLYIVKKVVEAHRGSIKLEQNFPSGTKVTVTIPLDLGKTGNE